MADKLSERLEAAVERLYENGMDTRDIVDLFRESAELARRVEGFVLVPVEPTPEMVKAAEEAYMPFGDMDLAIQMAIAASPTR